MRRGILSACKVFEEAPEGRRWRRALVTTTYRPGETWEARDVSRLTKHYREWCQRRGIEFRAVWVLELTKRGVPHYHLLMWLPRGVTPPKPDKAGWWRKGFTRVEWVRRPFGYLAKYASKGADGRLPPGARMYGCLGLRGDSLALWSWLRAPRWLQEVTTRGDRLVKGPGWWRNMTTHVAYRSPWVLDALLPGRAVRLRWRGLSECDIAEF